MPKYSFIVPVYNVEKYIKECLDSILCQTYKDFEIVVIDDGATDNSYNVCLSIANRDNRVRIVRQHNMGLGEARNTGIRNASGEFVIFIDSDDFWVSSDKLQKIDTFLKEQHCDVLCYRMILYDNDTKKYLNKTGGKDGNVNKLKYLKRIDKMIATDMYSYSACNKVVSTSLIRENNIYFNKGTSEDIDWSARLLMYTEEILFLDEVIYAYRQNRAGSITHETKKKFLNSYLNIINKILIYAKKSNLNQQILNRYISIAYRAIIITYLKDYKYDNDIRNKILEYRYLIKYLTGFKMIIFKFANFFSLNLFMKMLRR